MTTKMTLSRTSVISKTSQYHAKNLQTSSPEGLYGDKGVAGHCLMMILQVRQSVKHQGTKWLKTVKPLNTNANTILATLKWAVKGNILMTKN